MLRIVGNVLGDDVGSALQGCFGRAVACFGVEVLGGDRVRIAVRAVLRKHEQRERFQPRIACLGSAGGALLLEGLVEVLDALQHCCRLDLLLQLVGETALLFDGAQDLGLACFEVLEVCKSLVELAQGHIVDAARRLFAVAGDERDRIAVVDEADNGVDLGGRELELVGEQVFDAGHGVSFPRFQSILPDVAMPGRLPGAFRSAHAVAAGHSGQGLCPILVLLRIRCAMHGAWLQLAAAKEGFAASRSHADGC